MKKRFSSFTIAIVALLGVLFGGLLSWMVATRAPFFRSSFISTLSPIDQVLELISEHYVDSIDLRELQMRLLPKEGLLPHLRSLTSLPEVILMVGAGDIDRLVPQVAEEIRQRL